MFRSQEKGNKMEDYDEEALQNAEDWVVGEAEFASSWIAGGGWAGDVAQAWREYIARWAEPEPKAPEPPSRPERQDWW